MLSYYHSVLYCWASDGTAQAAHDFTSSKALISSATHLGGTSAHVVKSSKGRVVKIVVIYANSNLRRNALWDDHELPSKHLL